MSIELTCNPVIKNINARTLGGEDDRIVWADIKMHASVDPAELNQFVPDVSMHLWENRSSGKNEDGEHEISKEARFPLLGQQLIKGKWENIDCRLALSEDLLEFGQLADHFHGGQLHKLKFEPMNNSAYLEFEYTVQIPGMEIGKLIDRVLGESVAVTLCHNQGELDL